MQFGTATIQLKTWNNLISKLIKVQHKTLNESHCCSLSAVSSAIEYNHRDCTEQYFTEITRIPRSDLLAQIVANNRSWSLWNWLKYSCDRWRSRKWPVSWFPNSDFCLRPRQWYPIVDERFRCVIIDHWRILSLCYWNRNIEKYINIYLYFIDSPIVQKKTYIIQWKQWQSAWK